MTTVKEHYGFVPTSVLYFVKDSKLTYGFMGNQDWRKENFENASSSSMSEFNPNLAEFCVKYWSKEGDVVLDPFGGWGTRLFTALRLKRKYEGYEISPSTHKDVMGQIEQHNKSTQYYEEKFDYSTIKYYCSDGIEITYTKPNSADMIFTCPPYFNIEKYESTSGQLTDIDDYEAFMRRMFVGAKNYYKALKAGKYCVFVVGDWRENSNLRLFSKDIIDCFCQAGFLMHDFVVNKLNSAAVVGCGNFEGQGFVTKSHEYVLVFKKPDGDVKSNYKQISYSTTEKQFAGGLGVLSVDHLDTENTSTYDNKDSLNKDETQFCLASNNHGVQNLAGGECGIRDRVAVYPSLFTTLEPAFIVIKGLEDA